MPEVTQCTLRRARPEDAALLAALGARLFSETFGAENRPDDMRAYLAEAFSVEALRRVLADDARATWIAEDEHQAPIGYVTMRRGSTADGITSDKPAEVERIYVDQTWHGRRVGDLLLQTCIDHATSDWGADVLWLGVWEKNPRAIRFYEKSGFRAVGHQSFVLGTDVQRDLVMARALR